MPHTNPTANRLNDIGICITVLTQTLKAMAKNLDVPFLGTICLTTQSISEMIQFKLTFSSTCKTTDISWT
ncbi:hypothetical protein MSAN_01326500 [Mycena sanguinolenta]|uniref:Uncharacterized protein n=1 Tax=Mycena sanguinolenta TaxID=230812 RepID=A0A8H7D0S3_9AGAR|nr:hypothetical protein MSAN_01326500 [Mycena sanguinolenta]